MKTQVPNHYDPSTTAPYTIFKKMGGNKFFVNSQCILSVEKIITIGEEYLLIDSTKGAGRKIRKCILVGCYYREGILSLILREIRSQKVFTIDHLLTYPVIKCTWVMIGPDYSTEKENIKAIQSYCNCGNDPKTNSNTKISNKSMPDDLLAFEL
jgi:hypothetical protein